MGEASRAVREGPAGAVGPGGRHPTRAGSGMTDGERIARLEGRMDRIERKLDRLAAWVPVAAAFALGWAIAR